MDTQFLAKLDSVTQRLVEEIEEFAAVAIKVQPAPTPSTRSDATPKAVALLASEQGAALLCRDEREFQPRAVLHELLHLRRYWVDFVPQLVPVRDPDGGKAVIANQIENALEHLLIVPQEAQYGFDPYANVNATARKLWEAYPWTDVTEPWARRKNCLLGWLTASALVSDSDIKMLAHESLKKEALLDEADNFSAKIQRMLNSKEHCVSTAIRFLRIPRDEAVLVYLDIKNKKLDRKPIPEH